MGSRGREIEIPSPGVLSLFVHFLMGKRTRASAACERPFSGLLIPPRLLGVSPAALVGRNNPSKKVCSQVLHSFHRADLRRIEAQTADNTFVFSRAATKSRCKSACENRQRLISSCPCTSKEKMDSDQRGQNDKDGPPGASAPTVRGGQQRLKKSRAREEHRPCFFKRRDLIPFSPPAAGRSYGSWPRARGSGNRSPRARGDTRL